MVERWRTRSIATGTHLWTSQQGSQAFVYRLVLQRWGHGFGSAGSRDRRWRSRHAFLRPTLRRVCISRGSARGAPCAGDDEEQQGEKWRDDIRQNEETPEAQQPVASIEADQRAANYIKYNNCRESKLWWPKVIHVRLFLDHSIQNECAYPRGHAPFSTAEALRPDAPVVLKITGAPGSWSVMRLDVRSQL